MSIIIQIYTFIVTLIIMFTINKTFTFIALTPIPFIILHFKYFNKRFRKINMEIINSKGEQLNSLNENINGIYEIKSFKAYDYSLDRYKSRIIAYVKIQIEAIYIYITKRITNSQKL